MICSMRLDGSTACMTIDGATDTEVFRAYVRQVLGPTLRPGDVVIMDNLSPHKSAETLSLVEQLGATVLFLPAYSPDLNPIEKMWSKLKEILRSVEARSKPSLIEAIASALEAITVRVWHHQVHLPKALSKMTGIFTSAPRALLGNYFGRWYSFRK